MTTLVRSVSGRQLTSTVVVGIEHGKERANGEDIVVLCKARHRNEYFLQARRCVF